jgi:hypothetical protein
LEKHSCETQQSLIHINWYHGLRNTLYHHGNGLTMERMVVIGYAQRAGTLFSELFLLFSEMRCGAESEPKSNYTQSRALRRQVGARNSAQCEFLSPPAPQQ